MSEFKVSCKALRATEEICHKFHNDPGELIIDRVLQTDCLEVFQGLDRL